MQLLSAQLLTFLTFCVLVQSQNINFNSGRRFSNNFEQTFNKQALGFSNDGKIEIQPLTYRTLKGALSIIKEVFFADENLSKGCSVSYDPGAAEELEPLCAGVAADGLSVVAIDVNTREVVGVILNKVLTPLPKNQKSNLEVFGKNSKHKASKCFANVNINIESRVDLFDLYKVNCILEMTFLTVKKTHQRKGIAELLMSLTLKLVNELRRGIAKKTSVDFNRTSVNNANAIPSLVSGTFTSTYSQKISDKLGFDNIMEVSYDDVIFNGQKLSTKLDNIQKSARIAAKRV
ncbi:uncharacterized protein LOC123271047 [Cotesia glomerata]|uniref:Uncharacterized protein n=1 Tax=Cotesia glomerata TaxID=32391 RepID=A0AAV7IIA3_COTGL|nr:uncharacterized protein LOC123271047 [Cotesia glomerata]KAH0552181.1 hypothetical protein KQX54_006589 [Cotesia glomerata]